MTNDEIMQKHIHYWQLAVFNYSKDVAYFVCECGAYKRVELKEVD